MGNTRMLAKSEILGIMGERGDTAACVCVHTRMCTRAHACVHGKEGAPETERSYEDARKIGLNQASRQYRGDVTLYLLLDFHQEV